MDKIATIESALRDKLYIDKSPDFGSRARLGFGTYDAPFRVANVRSALIWNLLYPTNRIYRGDAMYVFNTVVTSVESLDIIKDDHPEMYMKLRKVVFGLDLTDEERESYNEIIRQFDSTVYEGVAGLYSYSLSHIAIPQNDEVKQIPDWLVKITNFNYMMESQTSQLTSLQPSINIYPNRLNSQRTVRSPIIEL